MILLEDVYKEFDSGFSIKISNLKIEAGEKINIFGPNGAGKTTFLKILAGLITPSSGSLKILESESNGNRLEVLKNLGFVPQGGHFYETLTVKENLEFYGKMYSLEKDQLAKRINTLLTQFALDATLNIKVAQLSKGMKQRLRIIKALLHEPQLLLLDEPYSGLDLQSAEYLYRTLEAMKTKTILCATHDFDTGIREGQRIILFSRGSILFDGQWQDSISAFKGFYRERVGQ